MNDTTMTIEKAREITAAVFAHCVHNLMARPGEAQPPLPDCSLEEMLVANRLVEEAGAQETRNEDGSVTRHIQMRVDPRGVAAHYALAKWRGVGGLLDALGFELKRGTRVMRKA